MTDGRLKSYVERIARLAEERKAIGGDIADILQEAKGNGYIPKTLRKVVARYMADPAKLAEEDALLETYEAALGRVSKALEAIRAGATVDGASKATGIPRATVARAAAVSNRRELITPPHDPATGEVASQEPAAQPDDDLAIPPHLDRRQGADV